MELEHGRCRKEADATARARFLEKRVRPTSIVMLFHNTVTLLAGREMWGPFDVARLNCGRRLGDDLIFRSKQGKQFRQESQWRAWDPVRRAFTASLPKTHHLRERIAADEQDQLDVYELRHFGASYMLNELELEPWVD